MIFDFRIGLRIAGLVVEVEMAAEADEMAEMVVTDEREGNPAQRQSRKMRERMVPVPNRVP